MFFAMQRKSYDAEEKAIFRLAISQRWVDIFCNGALKKALTNKSRPMGGAVAEWSKALLVRENKRKSKRSQVRPPTWAPFLKKKKKKLQ